MSNPDHRPEEPLIPSRSRKGKSYFWCACGKSANQPFCDGSHKDTEFSPIKWTAEDIRPEVLLRMQAHRWAAHVRRLPQQPLRLAYARRLSLDCGGRSVDQAE